VLLADEAGPVAVYGIPYLEPALFRQDRPGRRIGSHEQALGVAMDEIRADLDTREVRSVVLAHCFAAGVPASDVERDLSRGGLDLVPASVFDGPDYVALGHIHGRATLSPRVRYSGAPLHYSFGEADARRGGWLVDLDAHGLADVTWLDLPVPRPLTVLTGPIEHLLADDGAAAAADHWIKAQVTDQVRPTDGMRRLQRRFPHCVAFEWRPDSVADAGAASYAERVRGRSDPELVADFLALTRNGAGPNDFERRLVDELLGGAA
jgi:DNA repair protein SbcD/Mre11